jgi:CRP-like cAMP-binding protein
MRIMASQHAPTQAGDGQTPKLEGNSLLDGLPSVELHAIRPAFDRVRSRMRQVLFEQSDPIEYAYFPQGGVFSLLARMEDGSTVETLTVGNEGIIGLPALLGAKHSPTRAICQVSGWALRVPVKTLIERVPRDGALFDRFMRYAQARLTALSRSVACNRLHSAQQRYARWVLTTQDRVGTEEFAITQDFLAQMLGVTRPTISLVGQELQSQRLIHYAQGRLTVDDRRGLEHASCECYRTTRQAFAELLGVERGG